MNDWDGQADCQIDKDGTPLLSPCDRHRAGGRDLVETTVNDQRSGEDSVGGAPSKADSWTQRLVFCDAFTNRFERTDITPDRSPIYRIVSPDDSVDKLDKALRANPQNVEDASHIPR